MHSGSTRDNETGLELFIAYVIIEGCLDFDCKRAFIVGGGFSSYAGLPLTGEFTNALVSARDPANGRSYVLVQHLVKFVESTFGHTLSSLEKWPTLEDLFTCIDLAANSGHHLGNQYSAADLRTVRRCLIARITRMLERRHQKAGEKKNDKWKALKLLLCNVDYVSSAFVNMNWDDVVERRFLTIHSEKDAGVDYGCNAIRARVTTDKQFLPMKRGEGPTLSIAKIHGSINWLYCDNCQQVFWLQPGAGNHISDRLLSAREWSEIAPTKKYTIKPWKCTFCKKVILSTRLATFSYRKALDFPMFQKSWFTAEYLLRRAETWAFIGYSLPPADYEFKYLLKRIQLSRRTPPRIVLVTGGTEASATYRNYERFFGQELKVGTNCFLEGLDAKSTECLLHY